jgi:hypothetical protein
MRALMRTTTRPITCARSILTLAALLIATLGSACGQALLTAPVGATLTVNINPPFIAAHGDSAIVSVFILEPAGTPVPDGTVVQFFTTIGTIDEQGKTNDGVARVNLRSDTRSGTARITVFSGPATATSEVVIGAARPARLVPDVVDARIELFTGRNTAEFRVTAVDANGNGVAGVPIRFSVLDNPLLDRIIQTGDVYTNNSGDARGQVQTQRITSGTIKIRADSVTGTALNTEFNVPVLAERNP